MTSYIHRYAVIYSTDSFYVFGGYSGTDVLKPEETTIGRLNVSSKLGLRLKFRQKPSKDRVTPKGLDDCRSPA